MMRQLQLLLYQLVDVVVEYISGTSSISRRVSGSMRRGLIKTIITPTITTIVTTIITITVIANNTTVTSISMTTAAAATDGAIA